MSHHDSSFLSGNGTCHVGRAIIDDEGAVSSALDVGDDVRDHRCLIVGSDDNPYLRSLRRHRSSRNEEKHTENQHDADHSFVERGNLAQRKTIAHRLGFRSTTRMASNKLTGSPSRVDIAMRLGLKPGMRVSWKLIND